MPTFENCEMYHIEPIGKPRMTQADKWNKRPATAKYWNYKTLVRLHNIELKFSGQHIVFVLPMPKSWSKKKKKQMEGKPHQSKPDLDNLLKGLFDAALLQGDDCKIWNTTATKVWGIDGKIIIYS